MKFSLSDFKGLRPIRAPHLLEPNEAQTADNCKLHRGTIKAWDGESTEATLSPGPNVQTVFKYRDYWFQWEEDVDVVEGPVAADTTYRVYFTGQGNYPRKTRYDLATDIPTFTYDINASRSAPPYRTHPIEVPQPFLPCSGTSAGGGTGDDRAVVYVWTIVSPWGEEGPPSPPSAAITAKDGDTVDLTGLTLEWQASSTRFGKGSWVSATGEPGFGDAGVDTWKCMSDSGTSGGSSPFPSTTATVGDQVTDNDLTWEGLDWRVLDSNSPALTKRRIYRSNTSADSAAYQYVGEANWGTATYSDSVADEDLGDVLTTGDYGAPPTDLTNIVSLGRFFAANSGKDIYFSEPNYPHAWPAKYVLTIGSEPVAMAVAGQTVIVGTEDFPFLIYGTHPDSMTPQKLPDPYPCVSKRSIVTWRETVLYATTNGAIQITPAGESRLVTDGYYDHDAWQALAPTTMHGVVHDDKYFLFYESDLETEQGELSGGTYGALVIDLLTGIITKLDMYSSAEYVEPTTDTLYRVYSFESVLLQESGAAYPSRSDMILTEDGNYLLVE